jgi:hypothetical protein
MRSGHRVGGRDPKLTVCGVGSVNTPAATSEASGIAGTRTLHHRAYERSERSFHHGLTLAATARCSGPSTPLRHSGPLAFSDNVSDAHRCAVGLIYRCPVAW